MEQFNTHGGHFEPVGFLRVNAGGKHEENPNGGVQIGVDPQGVPNMLEENESVYNDYVYSDNIIADEEILRKHNLPANFAGKLYSEIVDKVMDDTDGRMDAITNNGLNATLLRLAEAQEEQKQIQQERELEEELSQLSPEELDELEAYLSQADNETVPEDQMIPEQVIPEQAVAPEMMQAPMMADGGFLNRYDTGGPKQGFLTRLAMQSALNEPVTGPVMQSMGVGYDSDGNIVQGDPDDPGASALRRAMFDTGVYGLTDFLGAGIPRAIRGLKGAKTAGEAFDAMTISSNKASSAAAAKKSLEAASKSIEESRSLKDAAKKTLEAAKKANTAAKQKLSDAYILKSNATSKRVLNGAQKDIDAAMEAITESAKQISESESTIFKESLKLGLKKVPEAVQKVRYALAGGDKVANSVVKSAAKKTVEKAASAATEASEAAAATVEQTANPASVETGPKHLAKPGVWRALFDPTWATRRFVQQTPNLGKGAHWGLGIPVTIGGMTPSTAFYGGVAKGVGSLINAYQPIQYDNVADNEEGLILDERNYHPRALGGKINKYSGGSNISLYPEKRNYELYGSGIPEFGSVPQLPWQIKEPEFGNIRHPENPLVTTVPGVNPTTGSQGTSSGSSAYAFQPYPTYPRYAGAITSGLVGLYDVFQSPDRYNIPSFHPVTPSANLHLIDPVYRPIDTNTYVNSVLANGAATLSALKGFGPSTPQSIVALDYNLGRNIGNAYLQGRVANDKIYNDIVTQRNMNARLRGDFDYTLDSNRAQILNNAKLFNLQNALRQQQLNYAGDTAKYAAIQNQIDQVAEALSNIGRENFVFNQIGTNSALDYNLGKNGVISKKPSGNSKKCGGSIKKAGK